MKQTILFIVALLLCTLTGKAGTEKAKQQNPAYLSDFHFYYPDSAIHLYVTAVYGTKSTETCGERNPESHRDRAENQ